MSSVGASRRSKGMKRKRRIILPAVLVLVLLAGAFFLYAEDYYRAEAPAIEALASGGSVTVTETDYGWFFDGPADADALIFYPGGKVEETAYAPLLHRLAAGGLDVCLVKMPFRLAIFGVDRAAGIMEKYDYGRWFVGGHSLGGAAAAMFAAKHPEPAGVILLAAYPTKPLEAGDLELTVYGAEDGVLNREKLAAGRQYASDRAEEIRLPGANHAQFGNYGPQAGDGTASLTPEEQQAETAELIFRYLREN